VQSEAPIFYNILTWLVKSRSYVEDFRAQYYQYESHREILMAAPATSTDTGIVSIHDLIDFISHVADCYLDIAKDFPQHLIDLLGQHHALLEPELRAKVVGCLMLLRKKEIIDSVTYEGLN
jgi:protein SDA1